VNPLPLHKRPQLRRHLPSTRAFLLQPLESRTLLSTLLTGDQTIPVDTSPGANAPLAASFATNDYPAALANAPLDSFVDPWGFLVRECTSYVAYRINRDLGITAAPYYFTDTMTGPNGVKGQFGDSSNWDDNARAIGFTVDHTGKVGAIAQWNSGHVAYIESVNSDGTVNVSEYNFTAPGVWSQRSHLTPDNIIHITKSSTPQPPSHVPTGWIDVASRDVISGWAFDADAGAASVEARIDIDGVQGATFTASAPRPDLSSAPAIGSPNHGFSITPPSLSASAHSVDLWVKDTTDNTFHLVASRSIPPLDSATNTAPTGWIDLANHQTVSGWAFDADRGAAPVQARIDIDGFAGTPFTANIARVDLAAAPSIGSPNHGFSRSISTLNNSAHTISLLVQDDDGTFKLVASVALPAILPPPSGGSTGGSLHPVSRDAQSFFDSSYYLAHNPDVAAAVASGAFPDAFTHFILYGQFERRRPSTLYDESYYLSHNPDIASAVSQGMFKTGFEHFVNFGFAEGRRGAA